MHKKNIANKSYAQRWKILWNFKMNHFLLAFTLAFLSHSFATQNELGYSPVNHDKPATIKVLLKQAEDGSLVEVKGPYKVENIEKNKYLSSGRRGKRFYLFPHVDGIKWGEVYTKVFQIRIIPTSSETTTLIDGIEYRGCIEVYNIEGRIHIVNEVDVESYLKSTLSSRFINYAPKEILDALAIIARTDTYYLAMNNQNCFWHVKAEKCKYFGNANTLINPFIDRAVDATKHLVMVYHGRPFPGTWTANCGGTTASYHAVFRKKVKTPEGVESSFAKKFRDEHFWRFKIDKEEFAKIFRINRVTGVELFIDTPSNKVYAIRVKDGNHQKDIDFIDMQKILGSDKIQSNEFTIHIDSSGILFQGYGDGFGTGLCIYSALEMATRGDLTPQILAEFFPHTRLQKIAAYQESTTENFCEMD